MHPSQPNPVLVRHLLEKLLKSSHFQKKGIQGRILHFVVEETLAGRAPLLNEDAIGVEVLKHDRGYDKVLHSAVRAHVGRLRTTLVEYYRSEGRADPVQIDIPKGTYVPSFPAHDGLQSVSTGLARDEAFREVRQRATERIIVVGTGMTKLARNGKMALMEHARITPIDLIMLDPEFIRQSPAIAQVIDHFFAIDDFSVLVKHSFDALKKLAEEWNSDKHNSNHIRLRVYNSIPSFSMTMIDPDLSTGEAIIEFYMYQCGEYRPRLHVTRTLNPGCLFVRFHNILLNLWNSAREVV